MVLLHGKCSLELNMYLRELGAVKKKCGLKESVLMMNNDFIELFEASLHSSSSGYITLTERDVSI